MNIWAEGKNANIEQLYMMIQDNFQMQSQGFTSSLTGVDNIMHGLASQASKHNTSWNAADTTAHNISIDNPVPKNLEQTM